MFLRQSGGLGTEHERVVFLEVNRRRRCVAALVVSAKIRSRLSSFRQDCQSAWTRTLRVLVVVETGALQLPVVHGEAERLHQVQARAGVGREPDHIARIGRDLRMHEDDVEHQCGTGGKVRATTQFTTRAAPARFRVAAISSSVAPVVMTSSSTAIFAPSRSRGQWNASRTFFARSARGSSACAGVSRLRSQSSGASRAPVARASAAADFERLVVAALAQAAGRQRNGQDEIHVRLPAAAFATAVCAKNGASASSAAELERVHQHVGRESA